MMDQLPLIRSLGARPPPPPTCKSPDQVRNVFPLALEQGDQGQDEQEDQGHDDPECLVKTSFTHLLLAAAMGAASG